MFSDASLCFLKSRYVQNPVTLANASIFQIEHYFMGKYILKFKATGASKETLAGFLNRKEKLEKWTIVNTNTKN